MRSPFIADQLTEAGSVVSAAITEVITEDPRLTRLKTQYEALSEADRTCREGVMTWEQVAAAIPDMNNFLARVDSLSEPEVYWLDQDGQLVVGDGCAEPAEETLDLDYNQSRIAAMQVPGRGLITLKEYTRKNKGQFEKSKWTWIESGENPSDARYASLYRGQVITDVFGPRYHIWKLGSCRVLRVKLNLEA